jgi:putative hydrolase of the HAD superfamily
MEPRAVVFDLDYTLAVTRRDRQALLDEATATAGVRDIDRREYLDAHGTHVADETRTPIFDAILDEGDPEAVARAYRRAVNGALVPVEGAADLVADLRERYRVGVLTDGPGRAQRSKLERLGWTDAFDAVVVTGDLPAAKPDPRTFEAVLAAVDAPAGETVFVGDHPEADVRGATRAGLSAVQVLGGRFDPAPEAVAHVRRAELVPALRDLLLDRSSGA